MENLNQSEISSFLEKFYPEAIWNSSELIHIESSIGITYIPEEIFNRFTHGISIAIPLSRTILESIEKSPNSLYKAHYKNINSFLDEIALRVSLLIEKKGFVAMPIPASGYVSNRIKTGHISHRHIAFLSGLGFYGINNLIVNPKYGSSIRLVSILTDMPLPTQKILESSCHECMKCVSCCPANAIGNSFEEFNRDACFEQVNKFAKEEIGVQICGLCLKPCRGR